MTFRLLYVLVVMSHERRKVIHFNLTDSPTAAWTAQQIVNAFPYDTAPKYLLRDRECVPRERSGGVANGTRTRNIQNHNLGLYH